MREEKTGGNKGGNRREWTEGRTKEGREEGKEAQQQETEGVKERKNGKDGRDRGIRRKSQ